ncbi:MAG TPA: CvpA family protein [Clostridiales bacterium]|nr:CvpA family protein [Clostridiales bacterium]
MNILDFIFIAVVVLTVFFAAKKGFVLSLIEFVSGLLAIFISYAVAPAVAGSIYNSYFKEKVIGILTEKFPALASGKPLTISISDITNILPKSLSFLAENVGLESGRIELPNASKYISIEQLEQNLAAPIMKVALTVIAFAILSIVLIIALRIAARLLNKLVKVTPLRSLNTLLGAVFGAVKGILQTGILAAVLSLLGSLTTPSALSGLVENSKICEFVLKLF